MAINALTPPKVQFFDGNGDPLSGGLIYTYEPGTSTPKATYSDSDGTVANTNPVELDSTGKWPIYLDGSYKIVVKTSAGVTVDTVDNFTGAAGFPVNDTVSIVQDPSDNTKQVRIDAGSITTGTTRVLTMPDRDVSLGTAADENIGTSGDTVPLLSGDNTWSGVQTFGAIADFSTAGAYFGTAAAANLLDDYEEGTFTPVIQGSSTAGTGTYALQSGRYTKVGRAVFATLRVEWTAHTGTGNIQITGLPFTVANVGNIVASSVWASNLTFSGQITPIVWAGADRVDMYSTSSGATVAGIAMDTAATITITAVYEAA